MGHVERKVALLKPVVVVMVLGREEYLPGAVHEGGRTACCVSHMSMRCASGQGQGRRASTAARARTTAFEARGPRWWWEGGGARGGKGVTCLGNRGTIEN